jgi:hypothetical protein
VSEPPSDETQRGDAARMFENFPFERFRRIDRKSRSMKPHRA